ncbi:MAG: hypothetical protein C4348_02685 [Patescibacteria group bacterium]
MKILQINKLYYPWIGGVERVVQEIAESINARIDADFYADQRGSVNNARIDADRSGLVYEDLSYRIRGAVFNVYNKLGPGHKENVYKKALEEEMRKCGLFFETERKINIVYDGKKIGTYRPDFIVENKVILEIKALPFLGKIEEKQIWSYLKGSNYRLALLVNFGASQVQIKRIVYDLVRNYNQHESTLYQRESASIGESASVEVLCCQPKGKRKIEMINGVKVYRASSLGIFWGMPVSFDFFRLFKKLSQEADIIDFHHPFPLADLALFLFPPKAKIVVHYHSDIVRQRILEVFLRPLIFNTLKKAKKIIVSNPNLIKNSPYLQKFPEKCEVIPFGVDLRKFEKFDEKKIENLRKGYGDFVLFVGRLSYYKGVQYLIEAMKNVEANLVIIGEGPKKKELELKIRNLGLEKKVFFFPFQSEEDLINFYYACSVFVLPSIFKSEAFGLVLIEAMACGKPVISTELGTGTSFVNQDGVTGFVVPPRDSKALAEALEKILKNKNLAQTLGRNARERVKKEFSLEKMIEKTITLYKNI